MTAAGAGASRGTRSDRIRFTQTGGFAGLKLVADVEPAALAPDEATTLERLVDEAMAERPPAAPDERVRDGQHYEVAVTRDGETTTLRAADPLRPSSLASLVAELQKRATPVR